MTQTTILASGQSAATSSDVVIAYDQSAVIGLFTVTGNTLPNGPTLRLVITTPGQDTLVAILSASQPTVLVNGPGTFRVHRSAGAVDIGVFAEGA